MKISAGLEIVDYIPLRLGRPKTGGQVISVWDNSLLITGRGQLTLLLNTNCLAIVE